MVTTTPPLPEACATGKGYSPPARKLPCLPFSASTLGSASTSTSPLVSSACSVPPRFIPGRNAKRLRSLDRLTPPPGTTVGGLNCPVPTDPSTFPYPVLNKFSPSCLLLE